MDRSPLCALERESGGWLDQDRDRQLRTPAQIANTSPLSAEPRADRVIWPYEDEDQPVAGATEMNATPRVGDVLSGATRGTLGAMAMTGMRVMTTELGLVEQTPPQALARQRARGIRALLRRAPREQRRGLIEAAHWAFGAGGGAAFGALPREVRRHPWAGPVYGLLVWLGFELGIAPLLGLSQAKRVRLIDRLALAADHLLYGLVLSAPRPTQPK
jgi:hypothetical protein